MFVGALPALRHAQFRLGMSAVGMHMFVHFTAARFTNPQGGHFLGLCARCFWLKAGTQFKRQS